MAEQYLYLTTSGRKSGLPREIEIWFTEHEGRYYIMAENGSRAQWVQNVMVNAEVQVRVGSRIFRGTARIVSDRYELEMAKQRSRDKYGWGDGLVVAVEEIGAKTQS